MDSKNSNFQKLYAVCKEFREKIDKCVNEHRNLFINFLMAIVTISVSGHMTT